MEERRVGLQPVDGWTGVIALIYTIGFMALAALLYFYPLPETNKDALLYLFGILSGIELTIIAFFFGGSTTQRAVEQGKARADTVVQEIAKSVPAAAVAAASAAAAAVNGSNGEPPK